MGGVGKISILGGLLLWALSMKGENLPESQYVISDSVLTVKASVGHIPPYAFADREDISEVRFEKGSAVTSIGDYAFLGCENIRKIDFPASVTKLGEGSFRECRGLREITIPRRVKALPKYSFAWCENLERFLLPKGLNDIGAHAFAYCKSIEEIEFPATLAHIGSNAFSRCTSLRSVTLPVGITELESYAFSDCENLEKAELPANGSLLGELIFSGCEKLRQIRIGWCKPPAFDCNSFLFEPDDREAYIRCRLIVPSGCESRYRKAHGWNLFEIIAS